MADRKPDMFWWMVIKHKWFLTGEILSKYRIVQTCLSPACSGTDEDLCEVLVMGVEAFPFFGWLQ